MNEKVNKKPCDIYGIRCDNKNCSYEDMSVPFDQYESYVNKACPLCGENLLTEKDYNITKELMEGKNMIKNLFYALKNWKLKVK
jgi:hypothetical protein